MNKSYKNMDKELAKRIRLMMLDVDGTLLENGLKVDPAVEESLKKLMNSGITIGLVSGRTLGDLEDMAVEIGMTGPIIAENGALMKLGAGQDLLELGYTRKPAEDAFHLLCERFPDKITGREDNERRFIDIVIQANGITGDEIREHIGDVQLLDSGYIQHLMQLGISKGKTLERLLLEFLPGTWALDEVMIFGDSATDLSLFELIHNNVLVRNPNLPEGQPEIMTEAATYISDKEYGEGFTEVALHIVKLRETK